eukprot:355986-Chlamydomonas_euryale.AAC.20
MERPSGWHPDGSHVIAGTYDVWTDTFENLDSPDGLFCAGHTIMHNGSVLIVGGHIENAGYPSGIQSIRTFTDGEPALYKVGCSGEGRCSDGESALYKLGCVRERKDVQEQCLKGVKSIGVERGRGSAKNGSRALVWRGTGAVLKRGQEHWCGGGQGQCLKWVKSIGVERGRSSA